MGKLRIKTLGDEQEEQQKKEAKARAEAKKIEAQKAAAEAKASADEEKAETEEVKVEAKAPEKKKVVKKEKGGAKKAARSASYLKVATNVDKTKKYKLAEALTLLTELKRAKFDESVELHMNMTDKGISGSFTLPHGTGKTVRIEIANQSQDPKHVEELVKKVEAGQIDFDVLIATPDTMPKLAKVARVLGPKGMMPNPKNGTVTQNPEEVAKKFQGGQVNFKTESKFPILHLSVGKLSFGEKKLMENIKVAVDNIKVKNMKDLTLKSTMSPAVKVDLSSL